MSRRMKNIRIRKSVNIDEDHKNCHLKTILVYLKLLLNPRNFDYYKEMFIQWQCQQ